jgi:hypothetical protein
MRGWIHCFLAMIPGMVGVLFIACENRDPLAPSFAASKGSTLGAPSNLTLTVDSFHQIWLAWQDNATNEAGNEVWRSTTGSAGAYTLFTTYPWPNITQGGNDGLQPSTEYCYKVRAYSTLGQSGKIGAYSAFSNSACATTPAAVPAMPSNLTAAPRFNGYAINVTWTDNSSNETGFRVERSSTSTGPWTSVGTTGPNATSLDDSQVPAAEQPACYRVFAVNSYGDSGPSNVDCTAGPLGPTTLVATVQSDGSVDLSWTDISAVEDGSAVYRWTASGSFDRVTTLPPNVISYHDPLSGDSPYYYRVYATKDGGTSAGSNTVSVLVVTMPPAAAANLDAVPQSSSVVLATWVDASANEQGFRVDRSTDGGATWVTVGPTGQDATAFSDVGLPSEQQVCYRVIAFNVKGESPPSNTDCTTPPAAPTGFTATVVDATTVDFAWTDNSAVEDGYAIAIDYDGYYWEIVATVDPNTTSYRLQWDYANYYTYFAIALKDGGYSDWSNEAYPSAPPSSSSVGAVTTSHPLTPRAAPRPLVRKRGNP